MPENLLQRIGAGLAALAVLASLAFMATWIFGASPSPSPAPAEAPAATPRPDAAAAPPAASPAVEPDPAPVPAVRPKLRAAAKPSPAPEPESAPAGSAALADAERRAFELERDNVRLRARLDDMLNWILDNIKGKYPLSEQLMANLKIDPLTDDLYVSTDLAELLHLTEAETLRLDDVFLDSRAALYELEAAGIVVRQKDENGVTLDIPPFDGTAIRSNLYEQIAVTLGKPRFTRFLQVAGDTLDRRYGNFGNVVRTLLLSTFRDADGSSQWFIRDEKTTTDPDGRGSSVTISEKVVSDLPFEYEVYKPWLSDDGDGGGEPPAP